MAGSLGISSFPPPQNLSILEGRRDGRHSVCLPGPFKPGQVFESLMERLEKKSVCVQSACMFLHAGWPCCVHADSVISAAMRWECTYQTKGQKRTKGRLCRQDRKEVGADVLKEVALQLRNGILKSREEMGLTLRPL